MARMKQETGIRVVVNGEERTVNVRTVQELLAELGINPKGIAVELNLAVVPKSSYSQTKLNEGDRIEIVHMIGGG